MPFVIGIIIAVTAAGLIRQHSPVHSHCPGSCQPPAMNLVSASPDSFKQSLDRPRDPDLSQSHHSFLRLIHHSPCLLHCPFPPNHLKRSSNKFLKPLGCQLGRNLPPISELWSVVMTTPLGFLSYDSVLAVSELHKKWLLWV